MNDKLMDARHSVRHFESIPLKKEHEDALLEEIKKINEVSGLNFSFIHEPGGLDPAMIAYGNFSGVVNYVLLMANPKEGSDFRVGYYGEHLALFAQNLGLNTCWISIERSMKEPWLTAILAVGYGLDEGYAHTSRPQEDLVEGADHPTWFWDGVHAAMKAPTNLNQQRFTISRHENVVSINPKWVESAKIDAGIVAYHFELGAKDAFVWDESVPHCPKMVN